MSPTTLTFDVSTTIALTIVVTGVLKNFLEVWVRPDNRLHDPAIQLLALVLGVAWSWVFLWATGPVGRTAALQAVVSIILGLTGGSAGIGVYHVSTAVSGATAPPAAVPTAPQPQAQPQPDARAATAGVGGPSVATPATAPAPAPAPAVGQPATAP